MSSRVDPLLKLGPDARRTEEGEGEVDELRKGFNHHGLNIPGSSATLHRSTVGIHQPIRIDPQEAGLLTGMQDHLDLDGVTDDRLTVSSVGDSPRIDLHHLGFIGTVELPTEEEFLTDSDVPVFHGSNIPFRGRTLHSIQSLESIIEFHCVPHFFGTRLKLSRRYSNM